MPCPFSSTNISKRVDQLFNYRESFSMQIIDRFWQFVPTSIHYPNLHVKTLTYKQQVIIQISLPSKNIPLLYIFASNKCYISIIACFWYSEDILHSTHINAQFDSLLLQLFVVIAFVIICRTTGTTTKVKVAIINYNIFFKFRGT